jgi:hypothetical protein
MVLIPRNPTVFIEKNKRKEGTRERILLTSALLREQDANKLPRIFCPVIRKFSSNCQLIKRISGG